MSNMTREIKFRAWSRFDHKMISAKKMAEQPWNVYSSMYKQNGDWKFMQYTGLKDKNGKEIFENDIILFKTLTSTAGTHQMIYEVRWKGKGFKPTRMSEHNQEEMEIIGNRFENPELLDKLDNFIK